MDWRTLQDHNTQNPNAGNGGDLVKHTVYLATIDFLLSHEPWAGEMRLRECHAGRGMYRLEPEHKWRRLLSCLRSDPGGKRPVLLRDAQRAALLALGAGPASQNGVEWYAGSAVTNALALARSRNGRRTLEYYEKDPHTRQILRSVLAQARIAEGLQWNVLPANEDGRTLDGERYVALKIREWDRRDLVLLDPFAIWSVDEYQEERDRYGAIVDGLIDKGTDAASLALFWTWGSNGVKANEDLSGSSRRIRNGYQDLLGRLCGAGFRIVLVKWYWGYRFAMWIVVSEDRVSSLRDSIDANCRVLSDHLSGRWEHPAIEVEVV